MATKTQLLCIAQRFAAVALLACLSSLAACKGSTRVTTHVEQIYDNLYVEIGTEAGATGKARFEGLPAFEKIGPVEITAQGGKTSVPLASVPLGKHEITVLFEGQGRGLLKNIASKTTFSFERKPLAPRLKLKPSPQAGAKTLRCKSDLCEGEIELPITPAGKLSVLLTDCEGCGVDVGGQKFSVGPEPSAALIDLTNVVGSSPATSIKSLNNMKIPLSVTREGQSTVLNAELLGTVVGAIVLRRVTEGPLVFAGDSPAPAPRSAAIVRKDAAAGVVLTTGPAKFVRDFDLIGVADAREGSLGSCGIYQKENDPSSKVEIKKLGLTFDITLFDRRSGKSVGRRTFRPQDGPCFEKHVAGAKSVTRKPADSEMKAWASSFLK